MSNFKEILQKIDKPIKFADDYENYDKQIEARIEILKNEIDQLRQKDKEELIAKICNFRDTFRNINENGEELEPDREYFLIDKLITFILKPEEQEVKPSDIPF